MPSIVLSLRSRSSTSSYGRF